MSHASEPHAAQRDDVDSEATPDGRLGERDLAILDFEREWWRYAGGKDAAVRDRFAISASDYYRALNRIVDHDAALAHDPLLVRRLRRQRLMRQRQRSARRLDRPV